MAHRSHVPKFGNWESEENVPYTVYFDKARKGKSGGKMINPNDPEQNSDMLLSDSLAPTQAPPPSLPPRPQTDPEVPRGHGSGRPTHERKVSHEGDFKQFADSPSRPTNGTKQQVHGARGTGSGSGDHSNQRVVRGSAGSEHSIDRSPIHPQARITGRGSASPSWEAKAARDNSHGTPGRTRFGGAARDELPLDKGSTVPKFGDWDENNPASADGYTHIFNNIREERQTGGRNGPGYVESPYRPPGVARERRGSKSSCFPCFGK